MYIMLLQVFKSPWISLTLCDTKQYGKLECRTIRGTCNYNSLDLVHVDGGLGSFPLLVSIGLVLHGGWEHKVGNKRSTSS